MPTKPTKPTTSASVKTHENMTPTTPTPTTPPSAAETLEARAARAHAAATASAVAAGRAADLRQEATERLQEEVARLEDLQRDERALDARIASDLAAIETARQRVADLPEAVARAKMSATIHAGTILESRSTKQTAELGVEHERLTDQITIWDQTAQARSSAEVEQRERLYDLRCRAEEAITTLQQQLARIDATERQAREQHGTALLAAFERDLAAADARRDAAEQDLHAAEATRTRLAAAADRRLEPWPVLLQLAQRRLAGGHYHATPARRVLEAYSAFLDAVAAVQDSGGVPPNEVRRSLLDLFNQSPEWLMFVLDSHHAGPGRVGERELGHRRRLVQDRLRQEAPPPPPPPLTPLR